MTGASTAAQVVALKNVGIVAAPCVYLGKEKGSQQEEHPLTLSVCEVTRLSLGSQFLHSKKMSNIDVRHADATADWKPDSGTAGGTCRPILRHDHCVVAYPDHE